MFIKDGKKTTEEEITHLPPPPMDPVSVAAARDAAEKELMSEIDNEPQLDLSEASSHDAELKNPENDHEKKEDIKKDKKNFLKEHVHPTKNKDDLLDIRVGNPLRRIQELLEDIKKQKAFSFTLRGSLGIMGVVLALSTFGFFSGSKALCDKGTQSYIGTVKQLTYTEEGDFPFLTQMADAYSVLIGGRASEKPTTRLILIQQDNQAINLEISRTLDRGGPVPDWLKEKISSSLGPSTYPLDPKLIVTGPYDSCSRTLKITQPNAIEMK